MSEKKPVKIACCVPTQMYDRESKLMWLENALEKTECDLFITPQEFFGGHRIMPNDLHMERSWVVEKVGQLAVQTRKHIAVGACCKAPGTGATEDLLYIDDDGKLLGWHSKFALPSYDDVRAKGHGDLWPETNYQKRITPINLPKLRLRVGTVFCWETFNQTIWGAYSMQGVNFIAHIIKFAPRGWLINETKADGKRHIVDFGNAPKSEIWKDRLIMAGRHQVLCPIAISCNSWDLGEKMLAMTGHIDELKGTTKVLDVPSFGDQEHIHTFDMLPEYYEGIDHHHSAGAFKAHVGSVEGFSEMSEYTMHMKVRRLEAHLLGGTTRLDCMLKASTQGRQKKSTIKRTFGTSVQPIKRKPK